MNLKSNLNKKPNLIGIVLFIVFIIVLGIYHLIISVKTPPLAFTDKNVYQFGENIVLKVENRLPEGIELDNCDSFEVETKNINGNWENISDGLICEQEEAVGIFSDRAASFDFISIKPGTFRIHINYKLIGLSNKINEGDTYTPVYQSVLYSNEFKVN